MHPYIYLSQRDDCIRLGDCLRFISIDWLCCQSSGLPGLDKVIIFIVDLIPFDLYRLNICFPAGGRVSSVGFVPSPAESLNNQVPALLFCSLVDVFPPTFPTRVAVPLFDLLTGSSIPNPPPPAHWWLTVAFIEL